MSGKSTKEGARKSKKKKGKVSNNDDIDPIVKVQQEKERKCRVAGRKLTLKKWTLRQGLKCSGKINTLIRKAVPTGNLTSLMSVDLDPVIAEHTDDFIELLAESIHKGNFDSRQEAEDWIDEELSLEDSLELFVEVGKLNIRPLMIRLLELEAIVSQEARAAGVNQRSPSPTL